MTASTALTTGAAAAARKAGATVDFNSLLIGANVLIVGLILQGWAYRGANEYADGLTVILGIALCAETIVALLLERRARDPFAILLAFIMTCYFSLRIYTLLLYPFSGVFERFAYGTSDTNYALVFVIIANVFLYAGLRVVRFGGAQAVDHEGWRPGSPWRAILLLFLAIVFGYFSVNYWTPENIPRVINFIVLFLSHSMVMLLALSYFILYRRSFSRLAAASIAVLVVAEIVLSILFGSRSAMLNTIQSIILVVLAIAGSLRLRVRHLVLAVLLSPLLVALAGAGFVIATQNRALKDTPTSFDLGQSLEYARFGASSLSDQKDLDIILPPIFARAGFFDFAAEVIAHRQEYSSIFTPATYFKSIVDNLLTPGFDVYDQPKIGNSLKFVYDSMGDPSKEVAEQFYQSDQLEIFGEFYALLGYASLPLFFLVAWLLKRTYVRLRARNPFMFTMKRVVVLFVWVEIINSFGLDWLAVEMFPLVVAILMYRGFFTSKRVVARGSGSAPSQRRDARAAGAPLAGT